ncbi:ORF6N domain-containing protein [Bacteroides sp.]|uniref:ORF6N domain-containing protein n=1 Tax=Bacteroides sp. TaxID=29523 RepID=UPI0023C66A20|nr:ORF6N domain-containing protein [Bacteroides sp.]MDE5760551.1 ORF6N domain-containing protein [Bacteroides sp.]MDE6216400.1 ORF6N domain-containing protein [Bacteroides sp.]
MEQEIIQKKIYEVRGTRVMLDKDLAELYQVEVKVLNQAVKRNIKRFPSDFMFQLTKEEWDNLKSQFVTSSWGGIRKLPFAFTEQGLAMLSGILNSDIAIYVNIAIMRAFVTIRQGLPAVNSHQELEDLKERIKTLEAVSEETLSALNDLSEESRKEFDDIYLALSQLAQKKKKETQQSTIGYKAIQERREQKQ